MLLGNLLKKTDKKYQKIPVSGISFDSRKVKKGNIFFAIRGKNTSGINFIDQVLSKKPSVIITGTKIKNFNNSIPIIVVKDVRESLSEVCSKFYKKKPANLVAVTGTNGKSSVTNFFYQILNLNKASVASIGTLGIFSKKYNKKINLTSIDALSLHRSLDIIAKNKVKNVILEASSHGLVQKRLNNLNIKLGIFTNLSHDHLDYHKNFKSYLNAKMYLFNTLLSKKSKIITDENNKEFKVIKKIANKRRIKISTIGLKTGNLKVLDNKYSDKVQLIKISLNSKIINLRIPLIGYFQVKNLLMAVIAAMNCGLNKNKIFKCLHKIKTVPGRLECVGNLKNNSKIIVDFAHTPDALKQTLIAIKKQFNKEIVIVFGCGGERDKTKRFVMGKVASQYCRKVFVTDDNPRNENPKKIRNDIIKGCRNFAVDIGNRKTAIKTAINDLQSNEILLVAGKGHEKTQDYGSRVFNFSDKKVINKLLYKRNLSFKKYNHQNFLFKKVFQKNISYNGVSINTKTMKKNNLFFAVKGKKRDGHDFVTDAVKKGAARLIISKKIKKIPSKKFIKVKNTLDALNDLASATRKHTSAQIIGITGSVGKTTLKNLIGFILKNYGNVYHSPHSFNNKFGVPLSLSNLKQNTNYGVFEIGMDKKGEIHNLSKIVKPEIAIITNISGAHFKNFNTLKDIARAKSEIINNISIDGKIILNKDDKFFKFLSDKAISKGIKVISFSSKVKADIFLSNITKIKNKYRLKVFVKKNIYFFETKYSTNNFVNNILACISTLYALNLDLSKIKKKFTTFSLPEGRGDIQIVKKFKKRFKFIDESYNANPLSMLSAINNMSSYQRNATSKKIVFLGDMLELGKKSRKFHKELSSIINKSDIDKVFVYGNYIKETFNYLNKNKKGKIFTNLRDAYYYFNKIVNNNDLLMVKGSNATGLNEFSKNIKRNKISVI